ncbi:hypothetical protein B0J12DRAFT_705836 [Macrophomina phaseolina]|uniref:Rhodopsin domain-containing protein n=1 Tax=Macrophomina phaseolina TaxID=35725 RepID=A0ABQ8FTQ0_9PEZI|nr:hypothetical protein B0J12DRAFT_705836 [Macrophomina phaseolina]
MQKMLRAVLIASLTITAAFVLLRCFIRARIQSQLSIDDYLLVIALTGLALQTSFGLYCLDYGGFGRKTSELSRHVYFTGLKWTIVVECTYTLASMSAKLSIAFLQLRVMGLSTSKLRRIHYFSIYINLLVGLSLFFTFLFQCYPDPSDPTKYKPVLVAHTHCTNRTPVLIIVYIHSGVNILLDFYYSLAIVPLIWALQNIKPVLRVSIIVILGMGLLASIATLVRLKYIIGFEDSRDPLYVIVPIGFWTWVEECLCMCAASIATFRPLLRWIPGLASVGSRGTPGGSGGNAGIFVTWRSRLDGARKSRRAREDSIRLEDLEGSCIADECEDNWGGDVSTKRRSGALVEYGEGRISRGAPTRSGEEHAPESSHAETASIATNKDGTDIPTIGDDAESQKSIIQHSLMASR